MGCASSSPLMNGGIVEAAKHAATDAVHSGENALNDVGENINGTVGHVKDALISAVHGIGNGVDNAINVTKESGHKIEEALTTAGEHKNAENGETEYTHIPLKDPNSNCVNEHLQEFKENLLKKAQSFSDDTDQIADDIIKETEDMLADGKQEIVDSMKSAVLMEGNEDKTATPTHSIDSLKTNSPEPEIEKAIQDSSNKGAPSPEPTLSEMNDIESKLKDDQKSKGYKLQHHYIDSITSSSTLLGSVQQQQLLKKYSNYFIDSKKKNSNNNYDESDFNFDRNIEDIKNENKTMAAPEAALNEPTQWEKLADAIVTTPNIQFDSNSYGIKTTQMDENMLDIQFLK